MMVTKAPHPSLRNDKLFLKKEVPVANFLLIAHCGNGYVVIRG